MKKYLMEILTLSLIIITSVLAVGVAVVKVKYPIAYQGQIEFYANKYELDSSLVKAIIKEESGYNTLAKSSAGAIGLMQIMPTTASWIAKELQIENYSDDLLFAPNINIEIGCFYLHYLFLKYNNLHKVLFSYNAGEGVMNSTYSESQPLVIETIEIVETREYIQRVQKTQKIYNFFETV